MIFVFGSNRQDRHGAGAAKHALSKEWAVWGQAEGLQGNSYAIITKELRPEFLPVSLVEISAGVSHFKQFARDNPDLEFQVTPIGCGLAGFKPDQIKLFFANSPSNVHLPPEFL